MVSRLFVFFKKGEHYALKVKKATFLNQFWTHFRVLDIYKCPKSVFESKTWKIVCFFKRYNTNTCKHDTCTETGSCRKTHRPTLFFKIPKIICKMVPEKCSLFYSWPNNIYNNLISTVYKLVRSVITQISKVSKINNVIILQRFY